MIFVSSSNEMQYLPGTPFPRGDFISL